jgi:predicted sugar kinase
MCIGNTYNARRAYLDNEGRKQVESRYTKFLELIQQIEIYIYIYIDTHVGMHVYTHIHI